MTQLFYVYRGDQLVGVATISSGKKGMETPLGFWTVFHKQKLGRSRKYDNAPMPFMQMYDEKGIAFHGGPNPGYPASHGCVRLPHKFAETALRAHENRFEGRDRGLIPRDQSGGPCAAAILPIAAEIFAARASDP